MKKMFSARLLLRLILLGLIFLTPLLLGTPLQAMAMESGLPSGVVRTGDAVMHDTRMEMDGEVTGDLVMAGQYASVSGVVGGDLLAAATEIIVDGAVGGNLRSLSTLLELKGRVTRNVSSVAGQADFSDTSRIDGSAYLFAETARMAGTISGNLWVVGTSIELSGRVEGDVTVEMMKGGKTDGRLVLQPGTVIGGTLRFPEGVHLEGVEAASVGAVVATPSVVGRVEAIPDGLNWKWMLRQVMSTLLLYLVGLLLLRFYPAFFAHPAHVLRERPLVALGGGLAFFGIGVALLFMLILVGLLAILLFRPLVVVAMGLLFSAILVSSLFLSVLPVALWLGWLLRRGHGTVPGALALGLAGLTVVRLLLSLLAGMTSFGGVFRVFIGLGGFVLWMAGTGALLQGIRLYHEKAAAGMRIPDNGSENMFIEIMK